VPSQAASSTQFPVGLHRLDLTHTAVDRAADSTQDPFRQREARLLQREQYEAVIIEMQALVGDPCLEHGHAAEVRGMTVMLELLIEEMLGGR
jgi:hypothetical protein